MAPMFGVVERGEQPGLSIEAAQSIGVRGQRARQNLDGDVATELGVAGSIHLAHPAGANRRGDLVGSDASAWLHDVDPVECRKSLAHLR